MRRLAIALVLISSCKSSNTQSDAPKLDAAAFTCASYCTAILANCSGVNVQYGAMNQCTSSCMHFPIGDPFEQIGNTLACRAYHAYLAATDAATHCVHAGPSGGGVCGNPCDGFCSLVTAECATQYPNAGGCATTCAGFAVAPAYTANVTTGNSASCRIYHATAASTDPTTHCPHTAMVSSVCM